MNGTGYEYAAAYNQLEALESLAQSLNEHQSRKHSHHQQVDGYSPGLAAAFQLANANRPESQSYDPTRCSASSNNASVQHRLLMAAYGHSPAQHQSIGGSTSVHQQPNNMAAFLTGLSGQSGLPSLQTILQLQQEHNQRQQQLNCVGISSGLNAQQRASLQQSTQQMNGKSSEHLRQSSFDELLLLHPSLMHSAQEPYAPLVVSSHSPLIASQHNVKPPPVISSDFDSPPQEEDEPWLNEIRLHVSSISLDPLSGAEVKKRLHENMNDVLTRYIPCVDFLVQCQQELRKGLEYATQRQRYAGVKRRGSHGMSPGEFFSAYVDQLPRTFYKKNFRSMDQLALDEAYQGLQLLRQEAKNAERQGCEAVKNNFLGGMKDGESWGLRKWLSKHGNALKVCTDLECIMNACQKLDRSKEPTRRLAALIRPMAKTVLDKLRHDIPASYQQRSTAHPYLPFFHRLEAALRGMSTFDPDDDDVICIDDSDAEDEVVVEEATKILAPSGPAVDVQPAMDNRKRTSEESNGIEVNETLPKRSVQVLNIIDETVDDSSSSGESDTESVIEIFEAKQASDTGGENCGPDWNCEKCSTVNRGAYLLCQSCGEEAPLNQAVFEDDNNRDSRRESPESFDCGFSFDSYMERDRPAKKSKKQKSADILYPTVWPILPVDRNAANSAAYAMAQNLVHLAAMFDERGECSMKPKNVAVGNFWHGRRFADALRLFVDLLRRPESPYFVEQVDDDSLIKAGNPPFSHVIKHPICFRDIVGALIQDVESQNTMQSSKLHGCLQNRGLSKWNMWNGLELLQAVDLVLLNSLAYGKALKQGKTQLRSKTNQIRKDFWNGITTILSNHVNNDKDRKRYIPTRRSECSGFVVYKINET